LEELDLDRVYFVFEIAIWWFAQKMAQNARIPLMTLPASLFPVRSAGFDDQTKVIGWATILV
jgi:hypothetical protein